MHQINRKLLLPSAVLAALLAIFGGGGWYLDAQRAKQRSVLSGFFESQPSEISSRTGGHVSHILVEEGERVYKGRPLIVLEATPAAKEAAAKQAEAEQARQRLREIENGPRPEDIRKQKAVVAEAAANLALLRNGPLPEEIDQAKARLQQAKAEYEKVLAGPRPQEIAEARAAERAARARLAQAERGPTPEEKAQARARLDAAAAQEQLALSDAQRHQALYAQGAISRQQYDQAQTAAREATARRQEMEEAFRRAQEGTPRDEMDQVRESYRQAKAALALVLAGSRPEDVEAAAAQRWQAQEALKELQRGSRREDVRAAEARVQQAQAALAEIRAGSRHEQIAQAKAAAAAAADTAQSSQASLADRVVRAPEDGVVESIMVALGDLVGPGALLLRLDNPQDIWVRVYVPEDKLAKVAVGSRADLRVDGIAEPVSAYVESIATHGEFTPANLQSPAERGKQVFGVRLRLKKPDPRVKAGMYATVTHIGRWKP